MVRVVLALILLIGPTAVAAAAPSPKGRFAYPPDLPGATAEVYKTIGDVKLNIYIFPPEGHRPADSSPAMIFFFGGGWVSGSPGQFYHHCKHLAERGMVAMAADYRVASRHQVNAVDCVRDAKSAVRWVRANARRLGIDPKRIAAGGGSAGGHLAAATATIANLDEPGEDTSVSSIPDALVLFNPALVLSVDGVNVPGSKPEQVARLASRLGIEPVKLSPYHHIKKGLPPTLIFHGTADKTVPFKTAELFASAMTKAGNRCKLLAFEGRDHGFFNYGRGDNQDYEATLRAMDDFLGDLGFLQKPAPPR